MSFQDRQLTCVECGQPFADSADDQAYRAQRGFTNEPRRCPDCRAARRSGGGGDYGGGGGGYGAVARPSRPMYDVVCASCGKQTQVPFQPRGDRPVYCSDCFRQQAGGARSGGSRGGRDGGGRGGYGRDARGGRY